MSADITHPVVAPCQPRNNDIKVWRYMDVTRLVALMETRCLHFARADTLEDPYEGSLALRNQIAQEQMIARMFKDQRRDPSGEARYTHDQLREIVAQGTRKGRRWVFINCWHSGESESFAMWKQYGSTGGSVAIQSTYQKLLHALPSEICIDRDKSENAEIYLGMVQYKNYSSLQEGLTLNANMLSPFIHKRTAFEYEREVRAFLMSFAAESSSISSIDVNVDIEQLVETIRVRPGTPEWERRTIEALIRRYGLGMKVVPSEIDIKPMF